MKSDRQTYIALAVLGLAVHAAVLGAVNWRTGRVDSFAFRSLDAKEYYALAHNLLSHQAFSVATEPPFEPDTWRTPGYPLTLATWMAVVGPSPTALIVVQQLLAVANVLLLFGLARPFMSQRRALFASLIFLFAPYRVYYSVWLLATTVFTTAMLLTWWAWGRYCATGTTARALVAGVLLGGAVLIRPIAMLIPVVLFVVAALKRSPENTDRVMGRGRSPARAIVFLCGCVIVLGSWAARNRMVAGHWGLSSQSGIVLAYFKAAEVELWRQGRSADRYLETSLDASNLDKPHLIWDDIDRRLQRRLDDVPSESRVNLTWRNLAQGNRGGYDPFVVSHTLSDIAREMMLDAPCSSAAFCLGRSAMVLAFPGHLAFAEKSTPQQRLRYAALGGLYVALAVAALFRLLRRRVFWGEVLFPLSCVVCLTIATAPQLDPRFRVPMVPFLLFIALLPVPFRGTTAENTRTAGANIGPARQPDTPEALKPV